MDRLTGQQIADAGLAGWAYLQDGLHTRLLTKDFTTGMRLVQLVGEAAEDADHHPDLDLRYPYLDVRLVSHDVGGVTERDIGLARTISEIAAAAGVDAAPLAVKQIEIALDSPDGAKVLPFWRALLDMEKIGGPDDHELRDDTLPNMWFQPSGNEEARQRFHFDVWVPPEVVEGRLQAALDAGGTLETDANAPSFWILVDPDGNRVCLCTWQERD
ncbi:4a-hydroxytetrahydrobiopterin dehydratase [Georgenia subflava]|uniref:Putative pterin-4-alpha-carbinolamine dehydratase n=1 Tax=Georgenia subflava TaxID=1622177 RepID=A0A6N7EM34_9MICO|nr:4a-hydroxytetrahydrobiopterin dehydratase [Georgenia subflava]MPV37206.1 4a-hydroxytetrahydrobiopterin dehydratase [Georgenia subflava]